MEQTVVRSGSPFEVLALVQGTLGFRPRESLVVVSLRPPRWRTGVVGRVDVPPPGQEAAVASLLAEHVAADGAGRCFLAVVTDEGRVPLPREAPGGSGRSRRAGSLPGPRRGRRAGASGLPGAHLAEAVGDALRRRGVQPEQWLVHGGRLYSYTCDRPCCPREGLPMDRLASTRVAAELVLDGRVLDREREEWDAALRAGVEPAGEDVLAAVDRALAGLAGGTGAGVAAARDRAATAAWLELVGAAGPAASGADPSERLDAATTALLLDALARLPLRDRLLGVVVPEALPDGTAGSEEPGPAGGGGAAGRADADAALRVLEVLAQRARPGRRAVPLGCAAYLLWAAGAGPAAGLRAEAALADDPSHSLSALVLRSVELGVPPPHVQRRRGAASPGRPPTC